MTTRRTAAEISMVLATYESAITRATDEDARADVEGHALTLLDKIAVQVDAQLDPDLDQLLSAARERIESRS